jgi:hypothetical protein
VFNLFIIEDNHSGICLSCNSSKDSRGRCQKMIRVYGKRYNFRPWHMIWIAVNEGPSPLGLQYSHRCHNENCINPGHGIWETDQQNKDRNRCQNSSHIILPDDTIILTCPHVPPCLTPTHIKDITDPRIIKPI